MERDSRRDPQDSRTSGVVVARQRNAARKIASTMSEMDSGRGGLGAPVRRSFFLRPKNEDLSPMGQLIRSRVQKKGGGRGGPRTRLSILLTLLWVCAKHPYTTERPSSELAELIGCDCAGSAAQQDKGAIDAVNLGLRDLEARGFVSLDKGAPGKRRLITLLREDGSKSPYSIPEGRDTESYVRVPEGLWTTGLLADLSAPGIAMLLPILDLYRQDRPANAFPEDFVTERYGLSNSTRRRGLAELEGCGLVEVERVKQREEGMIRRYNYYSLRFPAAQM